MAPRLPKNVRPTYYRVFLDVDLDSLTFEGRVGILIDALVDNTTSVVLHSKDLEILETALFFDAPEEDEPAPGSSHVSHEFPEENPQIQENKEQSTITVSFPYKPFKAGENFELQHLFRGKIKRNGESPGLKWANYKANPDGKDKKAIYTTCEPIGARTIFPCFDEPQLKASIELSVRVNKKDVTILSNSTEDLTLAHKSAGDDVRGNNLTTAFFNPIRMSTYLFVLVIGEFNYIEPFITPLRFPVRVYALKGAQIHRGRRMLDVAVKALSHYQRLFQVDYPLEKLDLVAFPDAGGLENWGCVVFGERFILLDEEETSAKSWQTAVETLCHGLAHQWFGNLVTMEWWDDLWLSEAFAQWAGFYVVDKMFPSWGYWLHFVAADPDPEAMAFYQGALDLDSSTRGSHPLYNPDASPDKFHELFDNITYMKGATVLRMLYHSLGDQKFFDGIRRYLSRHAHGNATHEDLWKALEESSPPGTDIRSYMEKWTKQVGYPLLVIYEPPPDIEDYPHTWPKTWSHENHFNSFLVQQRYLQLSEQNPVEYEKGEEEINKDDSNGPERGPIYPVVIDCPLRHYYETKGCHHLGEETQRTKQQQIAKHDHSTVFTTRAKGWLHSHTKLNRDQVGLYRVSYPQDVLKEFTKSISSDPLPDGYYLENHELSAADIVGLISDHLALVSCYSRNTILPDTNQVTTADLLDLILAFSKSPRSKPHSSVNVKDPKLEEPTNFLVWRQIFATIAKLKQAFLFAPSSKRILPGLRRLHRHLVDVAYQSHIAPLEDIRFEEEREKGWVYFTTPDGIPIKIPVGGTSKHTNGDSHDVDENIDIEFDGIHLIDLKGTASSCITWKFSPKETPIPLQISSSLFFSQATLHPSHESRQTALDLFDAFIANPTENPLNPNIRKYVFQAVARSSTSSSSSRFDAILDLALTTRSPEIRTDAFVSLGYCTDPEFLQKAIELLTDPEAPFYWLERWFLLNALQRQESLKQPTPFLSSDDNLPVSTFTATDRQTERDSVYQSVNGVNGDEKKGSSNGSETATGTEDFNGNANSNGTCDCHSNDIGNGNSNGNSNRNGTSQPETENINGNNQPEEERNRNPLEPKIKGSTGSEISWNWLKANWSEVTAGKTKVGTGTLGMYLSSVVSCFSTQEQFEDVIAFKEYGGVDEKYHKAFEDAIEGIRARHVWVERDHQVLEAWLSKNDFLHWQD